MGEFKDYCGKLFGQYNNNIAKITKESTDRIFYLLKNNNEEIYYSNSIVQGKFYMIKYNFNGNKLWCPIFVIDDRYNTKSQKRIIYAINLDYLPYAYRITFFDILFSAFKSTIDYNKDNPNRALKINFQSIHNILKNNGNHEYSITAFNFLKIVDIDKGRPKMFEVSTNFVSRFIFINTKIVNLKLMKDLSTIMDDYDIKNRLDNLISLYEEIKEDIGTDEQQKYYEKLKELEKKYKLFEDNKN